MQAAVQQISPRGQGTNPHHGEQHQREASAPHGDEHLGATMRAGQRPYDAQHYRGGNHAVVPGVKHTLELLQECAFHAAHHAFHAAVVGRRNDVRIAIAEDEIR